MLAFAHQHWVLAEGSPRERGFSETGIASEQEEREQTRGAPREENMTRWSCTECSIFLRWMVTSINIDTTGHCMFTATTPP